VLTVQAAMFLDLPRSAAPRAACGGRAVAAAAVPDRELSTVDVFENRLMKSYHDQVDCDFGASQRPSRRAISSRHSSKKNSFRRPSAAHASAARFLDDEVSRTDYLSTRLTMVLLNRPNYRILFESTPRSTTCRRSNTKRSIERKRKPPNQTVSTKPGGGPLLWRGFVYGCFSRNR
jgi:hypothetical protein